MTCTSASDTFARLYDPECLSDYTSLQKPGLRANWAGHLAFACDGLVIPHLVKTARSSQIEEHVVRLDAGASPFDRRRSVYEEADT